MDISTLFILSTRDDGGGPVSTFSPDYKLKLITAIIAVIRPSMSLSVSLLIWGGQKIIFGWPFGLEHTAPFVSETLGWNIIKVKIWPSIFNGYIMGGHKQDTIPM